jgi:hypothetical protein
MSLVLDPEKSKVTGKYYFQLVPQKFGQSVKISIKGLSNKVAVRKWFDRNQLEDIFSGYAKISLLGQLSKRVQAPL